MADAGIKNCVRIELAAAGTFEAQVGHAGAVDVFWIAQALDIAAVEPKFFDFRKNVGVICSGRAGGVEQ